MANYSFSTKNDNDDLAVLKLKKECSDKGLNFSKIIIKLIKSRDDAKASTNDKG